MARGPPPQPQGAAPRRWRQCRTPRKPRTTTFDAASPLPYSPSKKSSLLFRCLSSSLRTLELEGQRQERRETHPADDPRRRREDDVDVATLVPKHLAARAAGCGGRIGVRHD